MEHALEGEYQEAGIDHYITAGLAYFDNKDFKGAYDVKWRLKLLESLKPDQTQQCVSTGVLMTCHSLRISATTMGQNKYGSI